MPVRLLRPYAGQAVGTTYWGPDEATLRATGNADDRLDLASDYWGCARTVTGAAARTSQSAIVYNMNSASAQTLTFDISGYWPAGTVLTIIQLGTGAYTLVPATGVTLVAGNGATSLTSSGQNSISQVIKIGRDSWIAIGGLGT